MEGQPHHRTPHPTAAPAPSPADTANQLEDTGSVPGPLDQPSDPPTDPRTGTNRSHCLRRWSRTQQIKDPGPSRPEQGHKPAKHRRPHAATTAAAAMEG
ncbi:uteroglobin isoform X2 [Fukomys damarensis]|uniref:uteroglobin isoform X2 n=1 Tax=Fukomys damarensis TaxID=885580 RepID=UPI001455835C|nr:uteroglobin isoform X2 [Fukomys damarensis]